jgi:hypothetical protein
MSSSILPKEACPPVITVASPVTSDPIVHISSSEVQGSEGVANKSYIRHSTFYSTSGSTASAEVCSCQSEWHTKEEQIKALQEKAAEAQ